MIHEIYIFVVSGKKFDQNLVYDSVQSTFFFDDMLWPHVL